MCDTRRPEVVRFEMDLHEVVAREQIRDVINGYEHAGDLGRLDELSRCVAAIAHGLPAMGREPSSGRRDDVRTRRVDGLRG